MRYELWLLHCRLLNCCCLQLVAAVHRYLLLLLLLLRLLGHNGMDAWGAILTACGAVNATQLLGLAGDLQRILCQVKIMAAAAATVAARAAGSAHMLQGLRCAGHRSELRSQAGGSRRSG
jgi:hypothetical protein